MLRSEITAIPLQKSLKPRTKSPKKSKTNCLIEFEKFGYDLHALLVDEPQLSDAMKAAWERKLIADRSLEAANAEGEVEKRIKVKRAEAEGEALKTKTKAWVEARKLMGEGNAEALNMFVNGIHDKSVYSRDALTFFSNFDLRDAIRDASANGGKVVIVTGNDPLMNNVIAGNQTGNA